jgi:hypothetical protein
MAHVFVWIPLPIIAVPWGYVARKYPRKVRRVPGQA